MAIQMTRLRSWLAFLLVSSVTVWSEGAATNAAKIRFQEISQKAGVGNIHHTRIFPGKGGDVLRMFTSGGAAAAVGDFNNDGLDDLFVTDSDNGRPNRLFRNNGNMTFSEVAVAAGVAGGNDPLAIVADALWFDYDNDGWVDLLVARFGTPLLYHNEHNGAFKNVSSSSGLTRFGNTIAAIAFDYDNDGWLDLMFGNYFKPANLLDLKDPHVLPNDLDNAINGGGVTLWRNGGRGSFVEVTEKAGFLAHTGWTLDIGHQEILSFIKFSKKKYEVLRTKDEGPQSNQQLTNPQSSQKRGGVSAANEENGDHRVLAECVNITTLSVRGTDTQSAIRNPQSAISEEYYFFWRIVVSRLIGTSTFWIPPPGQRISNESIFSAAPSPK